MVYWLTYHDGLASQSSRIALSNNSVFNNKDYFQWRVLEANKQNKQHKTWKVRMQLEFINRWIYGAEPGKRGEPLKGENSLLFSRKGTNIM